MRMLRRNAKCQSEHSKSECSGGMRKYPSQHSKSPKLECSAGMSVCALDITEFLMPVVPPTSHNFYFSGLSNRILRIDI